MWIRVIKECPLPSSVFLSNEISWNMPNFWRSLRRILRFLEKSKKHPELRHKVSAFDVEGSTNVAWELPEDVVSGSIDVPTWCCWEHDARVRFQQQDLKPQSVDNVVVDRVRGTNSIRHQQPIRHSKTDSVGSTKSVSKCYVLTTIGQFWTSQVTRGDM